MISVFVAVSSNVDGNQLHPSIHSIHEYSQNELSVLSISSLLEITTVHDLVLLIIIYRHPLLWAK